MQQALEKLSEGVHRVEVFTGAGEAIVELDTPAVRVARGSPNVLSLTTSTLARWYAPTDEKL